eukprot:TRINITY_DN20410_c0_g1_i2.p1 TRINITY_DN20410_c0_g1~~TRINITY_DN20410_c0_g1_i2.p1  ORF type:complete len:307 (-),score=62.55 TRINITY_DN20410_c0_g1_i2:89-907(-)
MLRSLVGSEMCIRDRSSYSHEVYLRTWAADLEQAVIISVDYATAPEAQYPVASDNVLDVYRWCIANESKIGWGGDSLVMVGDSAGANLAASACVQLAREQTTRSPAGLVLVYPALYLGRKLSPSRLLSMWDPMLPKNMLETCVEAYLPPTADPDTDPRVSPLVAENEILCNFPWTHCVAAGCDPLIDDSSTFVHRLNQAGARASLQVMEGLPHGFLHFGLLSTPCRDAISQTAQQMSMMLKEGVTQYQTDQEKAALKMLHAELQCRLVKNNC